MNNKLSLQTYKCLEVQLGEKPAKEIYTLINNMSSEIEYLRKRKVDTTYIAPESSEPVRSPHA